MVSEDTLPGAYPNINNVRNLEASIELGGKLLRIQFHHEIMLPIEVKVKDPLEPGMATFLQEVNGKLQKQVYSEFFEAVSFVAKKFH